MLDGCWGLLFSFRSSGVSNDASTNEGNDVWVEMRGNPRESLLGEWQPLHVEGDGFEERVSRESCLSRCFPCLFKNGGGYQQVDTDDPDTITKELEENMPVVLIYRELMHMTIPEATKEKLFSSEAWVNEHVFHELGKGENKFLYGELASAWRYRHSTLGTAAEVAAVFVKERIGEKRLSVLREQHTRNADGYVTRDRFLRSDIKELSQAINERDDEEQSLIQIYKGLITSIAGKELTGKFEGFADDSYNYAYRSAIQRNLAATKWAPLRDLFLQTLEENQGDIEDTVVSLTVKLGPTFQQFKDFCKEKISYHVTFLRFMDDHMQKLADGFGLEIVESGEAKVETVVPAGSGTIKDLLMAPPERDQSGVEFTVLSPSV